MKYLAIFLAIVLILSLVGIGYMYMTANIVVEATGVVQAEASTQPELFDRSTQPDARVGTIYTNEPLGDIGQYQWITYTIRLRNNCWIAAESVELQVYPMQGDVMQLGDLTSKTLPAHETADYQATILTDASMHSIREINITYSMWGLPFTMRITCGK